MNKNDIKLIVFILTICIIFLLIFVNFNKVENKVAKVYYENDLILEIDLSKELDEYIVEGYNGKVKIEAGNGKIRVIEEKSPYHICSKQGYIDSSYQTIVCLPNKIIIEIESKDTVDAVVK